MAANPKSNENEFDPRRHKVYRVQVTLTYATTVVASSPEEAEGIAQEHDRDDRDYADADFDASEVTAALRDDETPWGPTEWGHAELTVNKALALIAEVRANPLAVVEPPPRVGDLRALSDMDWVRLASESEEDVCRPALLGVARVGDKLVACDGRRLHSAPPADGRRGHWDPETGEDIPTSFPEIGHLVPTGDPTLTIDVAAAWPSLLTAAEARAYVTIPGATDYIGFDAGYLADALLGAMTDSGPTPALIHEEGPSKAIRIDFPRSGRMAVVMPVRSNAVPGSAYHLGDFVEFWA